MYMSQVIRVPKIWGDRIAEKRESSEGEKRSEGSLISLCVFVSSWSFLAYGLGFALGEIAGCIVREITKVALCCVGVF